MQHITRVLSMAAASVIALAFTAAAEPRAAAAVQTPRIDLRPSVVSLLGQSTITVSGIDHGSLYVRLAGAALPWQPLRSVHGSWAGALPTPPLRGVYPIVLRTGAGSSAIRPPGAFLRVLDRGALARPSFDDPAAVARWWVQRSRAGRSSRSRLGPGRPSTSAMCGSTVSSSSRTALRGSRRSALGSACSSPHSETGTTAAGGCSRRLSNRDPAPGAHLCSCEAGWDDRSRGHASPRSRRPLRGRGRFRIAVIAASVAAAVVGSLLLVRCATPVRRPRPLGSTATLPVRGPPRLGGRRLGCALGRARRATRRNRPATCRSSASTPPPGRWWGPCTWVGRSRPWRASGTA